MGLSPGELPPGALVASLPKKEAHRLWGDLGGGYRLAFPPNPDSPHALPLNLASLLENAKRWQNRRDLGHLGACRLVRLSLCQLSAEGMK